MQNRLLASSSVAACLLLTTPVFAQSIPESEPLEEAAPAPEKEKPNAKIIAPAKGKPQEIPPPQADDAPVLYNVALLQGLNKVTANIQEIRAPLNEDVTFGNLHITAERCWKSLPGERPENAALLQISEAKPGEADTKLFLGWMFASTPGVSSLEHPVYDVSVIDCLHVEQKATK